MDGHGTVTVPGVAHDVPDGGCTDLPREFPRSVPIPTPGASSLRHFHTPLGGAFGGVGRRNALAGAPPVHGARQGRPTRVHSYA